MRGHILLIDDDPDEWDIFNEALQQVCESCKCTYADGALDGLNMLRYIRPDVIFLDINMPAMNGWEFLERYAALDRQQKANVVIVMLTTSLNPDDRAKASSLPDVSGFETKPLTPEKLQSILEKYFPESVHC